MTEFDYSLPYPSRRQPLLARNIVATSQPLAAQAGLRMLANGSNAVDAALAAAITLTVVEPTGNGLGSDAFAIVWDGTELHGLNASGRAPAAWTPERFAGLAEMPRRGWESVTVPGVVDGWAAFSERLGRLPFEDLFGPAITCAEEGFAVSPTIAAQWARVAGNYQGQPGFDETFLPAGRTPRPGERFSNAELGRSLALIAASKGREFYEGSLADRMVAHAAGNGAALSSEDLQMHRSEWCGTIAQACGSGELHEIPPNGQGIAALVALGILERLGLDALEPDSPESLHLQIEAIKLGMADADAFVGEPEAMNVTPAALLEDGYLDERAALIDKGRAREFNAGAPRTGGTVYVSAADQEGMMVSWIQSNYEGFGSGVVVPGTGISLHNRAYAFSLDEEHPNHVGPGKRPFHTIIPGFFMAGGRPAMSFGVMGGPMQAQGHVQMVLRTQLYGQNPQAASDAPRWRFVAGRRVALEADMDHAIASALADMGHEVVHEPPEATWGYGGAQLICRTDGGYIAGSDHRKDGQAVGF